MRKASAICEPSGVEQGLGPWPMRIEQCAELVARRGLGGDVVIAQPHQALQLT
ncbi:MAG: hypothetical protein ACRDS9_02545 [Pseudonocardiaceae bacterium]